MVITKTNGAMAVTGFNELIILMDCSTAEMRYTKLAGRKNCSMIALGKKENHEYLVVSI
jgi:hypothetical protein